MRESNDIRTRPPPDLIIGGWRVLKYKKNKKTIYSHSRYLASRFYFYKQHYI